MQFSVGKNKGTYTEQKEVAEERGNRKQKSMSAIQSFIVLTYASYFKAPNQSLGMPGN